MSDVVASLLPLALAIALGPVPILAIAIMLRSREPRPASIGFAVGWVVGLFVQVVLLTAVFAMTPEGDPDNPTLWIGVVQVVLGAGLILFAVKKIVTALMSSKDPETPAFLAKLADLPPNRAVLVGVAAVLLNLKHPVLVIPVGTFIVQEDLSVGQILAVIVVFVLLSSLTVLGATIGYAISPVKVGALVNAGYDWMVRNMTMVSAALLLFIGANVLGKGIERLWG